MTARRRDAKASGTEHFEWTDGQDSLARFDAFYEFAFERIYRYAKRRTDDEVQTQTLCRRILIRAMTSLGGLDAIEYRMQHDEADEGGERGESASSETEMEGSIQLASTDEPAPDPTVEESSDQLRVLLPTRWAVTEARSYRLHDPTGIVIDIPGGMASERARWIDTAHDRVRSVRVLEREGGVRFIIYLNDEFVPRYRVGSRPGADLVLADPSVSRLHLEISVEADGHRLRDLGSTIPTVPRNLGIAYWNIHRDAERARAAYLEAIALDPADPRLVSELDQLCEKINDPLAERLAFLEARRELVLQRDDATVALAESIGIPVIVSGGVATNDDVVGAARLCDKGICGVIVGRAIYAGGVHLDRSLAQIEAV